VRVVAATNARLESLVEQGRFRGDLFYRLRVAALALPPLRERKDEIPALIAHFVRKALAETNRKQIVVGDDVVAAMLLYDWPGNLRQLSNELRRMVALAEDGSTLHTSSLSPEISEPWFAIRPPIETPGRPGVVVRLDQPLEIALEELERAFIERALAQSHGRVTDAAQLLGISRKGLFLKRKKLGLE
jgi:two-component system response regulator HupR/HoxA